MTLRRQFSTPWRISSCGNGAKRERGWWSSPMRWRMTKCSIRYSYGRSRNEDHSVVYASPLIVTFLKTRLVTPWKFGWDVSFRSCLRLSIPSPERAIAADLMLRCRFRRDVLDRTVCRPDGAAVRAMMLTGLGAWKCLPLVNAALRPDVPTFFLAEDTCRLLDF